MLTGYTLATKAIKVKNAAHVLTLYSQGHPMVNVPHAPFGGNPDLDPMRQFKGKPADILTTLRPAGNLDNDRFIRLPGLHPMHSEVRSPA